MSGPDAGEKTDMSMVLLAFVTGLDKQQFSA